MVDDDKGLVADSHSWGGCGDDDDGDDRRFTWRLASADDLDGIEEQFPIVFLFCLLLWEGRLLKIV